MGGVDVVDGDFVEGAIGTPDGDEMAGDIGLGRQECAEVAGIGVCLRLYWLPADRLTAVAAGDLRLYRCSG